MTIRYRDRDRVWNVEPTGIVLPAALGKDAARYVERVRRALARRATQRA